jgi:ABC-type Fe3+-hydroxamate transport system substrate-binding protein
MVATEQTFLGDLFRTAGFRNVFAKDKIGYPTFDDEVLIRTNPDQIIELVHEKDDTPFAGHAVIELPIADFLPHANCVLAMKKWLASY